MTERFQETEHEERLIRWFEDLPSSPDMRDVVVENASTASFTARFVECSDRPDLVDPSVREMHGMPSRWSVTQFQGILSQARIKKDERPDWSLSASYRVEGRPFAIGLHGEEGVFRFQDALGEPKTTDISPHQAARLLSSLAVARSGEEQETPEHIRHRIGSTLGELPVDDPNTITSMLRYIGARHGRFSATYNVFFAALDRNRALAITHKEVHSADYTGTKIDYRSVRQNQLGQSVLMSAIQNAHTKRHERPLYICGTADTEVTPDRLLAAIEYGDLLGVPNELINSETNRHGYAKIIASIASVLRPELERLYMPQPDLD